MPHLNQTKNPAIKGAAERLGVFKSAPQNNDPIHLAITKDFEQILEQAGLNDANSSVISDILLASVEETLNITKVFESQPSVLNNDVIDIENSLNVGSESDLSSDFEYSNVKKRDPLRIRIPNN